MRNRFWHQNKMAKIETILFDLDGTLYQDRTYVNVFLQALLKDSAHAFHLHEICEEAQWILAGKHHVMPGQFVDMVEYTFQGYEPLLYRKGMDVIDYTDFDERYIYIGDGWQVCFLIAKVLGYHQEQISSCFLHIRSSMCQSAYQLSYNKGLPTLLKGCKKKGIRTILMSNTIEKGADYFLKTMHLEGCFDDIVYGAKKPLKSQEHFHSLGLDPVTTLAIGDVPYNDLYPIHALGGHSIVMSEVTLRDASRYSKVMSSFSELNAYLKQLIEKEGVI